MAKTKKEKAKATAKVKSNEKSFKEELVGQMLNLTTSGFGLVAALAWNEAIQGFVKTTIQSYIQQNLLNGKTSTGLISVLPQFIYAIIITIFAVTITYQLSKLAAHLQTKP